MAVDERDRLKQGLQPQIEAAEFKIHYTRISCVKSRRVSSSPTTRMDDVEPQSTKQVPKFRHSLLSQTPQLQVSLSSPPSFHHDYNYPLPLNWMGKNLAANLMIDSITWPLDEHLSRFSRQTQECLIALLPGNINLLLQVAR